MTTDSSGGSTPAGDGRPRRPRTRFGPEPILLFPLGIAFLGALPVGASVPWLSWVLLLPLAGAVWVLRAGVRVEPSGLLVGNGLRRKRFRWSDVQGFDVPRRGPVRVLHPGGRTPLLALPRRELPRLLDAAEQVGGAEPGSAAPA